MAYLNGEEMRALVSTYQDAKIPDLYGSGLLSELLTRACLKLGYNPILASRALQQFASGNLK